MFLSLLTHVYTYIQVYTYIHVYIHDSELSRLPRNAQYTHTYIHTYTNQLSPWTKEMSLGQFWFYDKHTYMHTHRNAPTPWAKVPRASIHAYTHKWTHALDQGNDFGRFDIIPQSIRGDHYKLVAVSKPAMCMYVCMFVQTSFRRDTKAHKRRSLRIGCLHLHVYVYIYIHTHTYTCIRIYIYIHIYIRTHKHTHAYICCLLSSHEGGVGDDNVLHRHITKRTWARDVSVDARDAVNNGNLYVCMYIWT